jgi:hypothetical protein
MLTGTGQRSAPCRTVSSTRSVANVPQLMSTNPTMFGATTRSRPNGSLRAIAAVRAANRSPGRAFA